MSSIDWTAHDQYPECTIECGCGQIYRSHSKFVATPTAGIRTRKPCPGCGATDNVRKASSDPEKWSIGDK